MGGFGEQSSESPFSQSQEFTSNGTFIVPADVTLLWVTLVGPGGGGAGGSTVAYCGGGGGGGESWIRFPLAVTPGQAIPVTIGIRGTCHQTTPTNGGSSSFGSLLTAVGGYAGTYNNNGVGSIYGGVPGARSGEIGPSIAAGADAFAGNFYNTGGGGGGGTNAGGYKGGAGLLGSNYAVSNTAGGGGSYGFGAHNAVNAGYGGGGAGFIGATPAGLAGNGYCLVEWIGGAQ